MSRRVALGASALALILVGLLSGVALAATPEQVAPIVADQGYYLDPGVGADPVEMSNLVFDANSRGARFFYVDLASDPAGGAVAFADAILDRVPDGTAVVLSPGELGYASDVYSQLSLDAAADDALPVFDRGDADGFAAFTDSLIGASGASGGGGGGGGGLIVLLVIVVVIAAVIGFVVWRNRRKQQQGMVEDIEEARKEIKEQLAALANEVLELSDQSALSGNQQAIDFVQEASATYASASDEAEKAQDLPALEALADRLDDARWQMAAAKALMEGKPVPPKPADRPPACFFDAQARGGRGAGHRPHAGGRQGGRGLRELCREAAPRRAAPARHDRRGRPPRARAIRTPVVRRGRDGAARCLLDPPRLRGGRRGLLADAVPMGPTPSLGGRRRLGRGRVRRWWRVRWWRVRWWVRWRPSLGRSLPIGWVRRRSGPWRPAPVAEPRISRSSRSGGPAPRLSRPAAGSSPRSRSRSRGPGHPGRTRSGPGPPRTRW